MGTHKKIMKKIKKVLISVSDKKNLKILLKVLAKHNVEIISSGGTYKEIKKLKFKCLKCLIILVHQKYLVVELKHYIQKYMLEY